MATATQTFNLTGTLGGLTFGLRDSSGLISNGSNSLMTSVTKAFKDVVTVESGSYNTLLTFSATIANASLATIKKILLINKSSTITARVGIIDTGAKAAYVELLPGSALFIDSEKIETKVDGSGFSALTDINTINAAGVSGTAAIHVLAVGT